MFMKLFENWKTLLIRPLVCQYLEYVWMLCLSLKFSHRQFAFCRIGRAWLFLVLFLHTYVFAIAIIEATYLQAVDHYCLSSTCGFPSRFAFSSLCSYRFCLLFYHTLRLASFHNLCIFMSFCSTLFLQHWLSPLFLAYMLWFSFFLGSDFFKLVNLFQTS